MPMTNAKCLIRKKTLGHLFFIVGLLSLFVFLFSLFFSTYRILYIQLLSSAQLVMFNPIHPFYLFNSTTLSILVFSFSKGQALMAILSVPCRSMFFFICDCYGLGSLNNCKVGRRLRLASDKKICRPMTLVQSGLFKWRVCGKVSLSSCNDGQGRRGLDNKKIWWLVGE